VTTRTAGNVNYQQLAHDFKVGDAVTQLIDGVPQGVGRVVAVWPAIGMVDVQYNTGHTRLPVEDVIRQDGESPYVPPSVETNTVPGGAGTVPVSGGPHKRASTDSISRVAQAFVKKSMYWKSKDRQYACTRAEVESGAPSCPKCGTTMRKARYKRRGGMSERLLACPDCLFLIKPMDAGME
jgi:hypothetical protein